MLTRFEVLYLALEPFLLPVHGLVRREIRKRIEDLGPRLALLDAGGRKSHYTIGIPADITVTELPRQTDVQQRLHLGIDDTIIRQVQARRSNIHSVLLDDMTRSALPSASFDIVVSVEVLEHVADDESFVRNVARVMKPDGLFLMTTPNGDYVRNTNPDHKRHYSRSQLLRLLSAYFESVAVWYAVKGGWFRKRGLESFSVRHPIATILAMVGNFVNSLQSRSTKLAGQPIGTHHLFAVCRAPTASQGPV